MKAFVFVGLFALLGATTAQNCSSGQFECANGRCIFASQVCDQDNDCKDGSDEPPILDPALCRDCSESEFRCDIGYCIPALYVCDLDNDCIDGSDERQNCPPCPPTMFECEIGGCIPESYTCDDTYHCTDYSDELEELCPCSDSEWRCDALGGPGTRPPGFCIPQEFVCDEDNIWDCPNGSDEKGCDANPIVKRPRVGPTVFRNDFSKIVYRHKLRTKSLSKKH